jgi:hypothetical protein
MQATVGAPAAVQHNGSCGHTSYQLGYAVTKVTPTGQVTIKRDSDGYERKFKPNGHEMNKLAYGDTLRLDVEAVQAEMNRVSRHRAAADAINNVRLEEQVKHTWGADSMRDRIADLEALLAKAKEAVNQL